MYEYRTEDTNKTSQSNKRDSKRPVTLSSATSIPTRFRRLSGASSASSAQSSTLGLDDENYTIFEPRDVKSCELQQLQARMHLGFIPYDETLFNGEE